MEKGEDAMRQQGDAWEAPRVVADVRRRVSGHGMLPFCCPPVPPRSLHPLPHPAQVCLSTRPEESVGTDESWDEAQAALVQALNAKVDVCGVWGGLGVVVGKNLAGSQSRDGSSQCTVMRAVRGRRLVRSGWSRLDSWASRTLSRQGWSFSVDEGGGAFYGPKIDIRIRDALGRRWQCSTVQLDFTLPERFGLTYTARDGASAQPIMIHRALFGSLERFFGILIEHYSGWFPLWLAPVQIALIPVDREVQAYVDAVADAMRARGIRVTVAGGEEERGKGAVWAVWMAGRRHAGWFNWGRKRASVG